MAIKGIVFDNQAVTAKDHGRLFEKAFDDGVISGCTLSINENTLNISAGFFICAGRLMKINSNEAIALSGSGYIRVKVVIDTSQASSAETFRQASFAAENADSISGFSNLQKDDINGSSAGIYEYAFCYLHYEDGWTVYSGPEKCLNHVDSIVIKGPLTVSSWTSSPSGAYRTAGYTYKKDITVTGCKSSWTGDVIFDVSSVSAGNISPCFETSDDKITVYSKKNVSATVERIEVRP